MTSASTKQYRAWEGDSTFPALGAPFFSEHLARYRFAQTFARGRKVLELACGKGFGSHALGLVAQSVTAIDLNEESLAFAKRYYSLPNVQFQKMDVTDLSPLQSSFDLVVAFEVIEHLFPSQTDAFLTGVYQSLRPGGRVLISTPNHEVVVKSGVPIPSFHINNFSSRQLYKRLQKHFESVQMLGQVKSQGALLDTVHFLDVWNLRHSKAVKSLREWLKEFKGADSFPKPTSSVNGAPWSPSQGWGNSTEYFFSPYYWRQAGMTVSVCQRARSSK